MLPGESLNFPTFDLRPKYEAFGLKTQCKIPQDLNQYYTVRTLSRFQFSNDRFNTLGEQKHLTSSSDDFIGHEFCVLQKGSAFPP